MAKNVERRLEGRSAINERQISVLASARRLWHCSTTSESQGCWYPRSRADWTFDEIVEGMDMACALKEALPYPEIVE